MLRKRVCVILKTKKGVLVARHAFNRKYSLPGGGVKWGEDVFQALKRELKEELGVGLKNVRYLCTLDLGLQRHLVYEAKALGTPTKKSWEIRNLGYVGSGVKLSFSTKKILEQWQETKQKKSIPGKTM